MPATHDSPDLVVHALANGGTWVEAAMPAAPLTCLDLWCRAGSAGEAPAEAGMAHFLEHMVFRGSEALPAGAFDRAVEELGGSSNAATGYDDVHFHVLVPPRHAPRALELLLDLVLAPRIDAAEFALERRVVLEEIAQSHDQPDERVIQDLLAFCCAGHPYGRPILGTPETLEASDPAAMRAFHHRHYTGPSCCLAVAGAPVPELGARIAASGLARLPAAPRQPCVAGWPEAPGRHCVRVPRLEAGRLLMAWPHPPAGDLDGVVGGDIATSLLGEGRRSVFVHRLREELRLVESVDLDLNVMEAGSLALLEVVAPPERLDAVEQALRDCWRDLLEAAPDERAVARAHRLVGNGLRFALETPSAVAAMAGSALLWGRRDRLDHPLSLLEAWPAGRIWREQLPRFDPDRATILKALPA